MWCAAWAIATRTRRHWPTRTVAISASSGLTWTVKTDAAGHYQRWLDQAGSPLTVTLDLADYLPQSVNGITVSAGLTTTVNFDLLWQRPCVQVVPLSIR